MRDNTEQNKSGKRSFQVGINSILLWAAVIALRYMNTKFTSGSLAMTFIVLIIKTIIAQIIGIVLGIIGLVKKNIRKIYLHNHLTKIQWLENFSLFQ